MISQWKNKTTIVSLCCFSILAYFNETSVEKNFLKKTASPTEHSILLDLSSKTDKVIYDNLLFSNYNCALLNPKQAQCTQFKPRGEIISSNGAVELYNHNSGNGRTFKIFKLTTGEAQIELKTAASEILYRYSFSSVDQIPQFAENKGLFTTGNVEWDMSSLDHLL